MKTLVLILALVACRGCVTIAPEPVLPATMSISRAMEFEGQYANTGVRHRSSGYPAAQEVWLEVLFNLKRAGDRRADFVTIREDAAGRLVVSNTSRGAISDERRLTKGVDYAVTADGLEIRTRPRGVFVERDVLTTSSDRFRLRLATDGRLIVDWRPAGAGAAFVVVPAPYRDANRDWCEFRRERSGLVD